MNTKSQTEKQNETDKLVRLYAAMTDAELVYQLDCHERHNDTSETWQIALREWRLRGSHT